MTESQNGHVNGRVPRVVIIGGGIAGLSTAYELERAAAEAGPPLHITLLEASDRWGGKIVTEHRPGTNGQPFVVEGGPDSFITQKPWAWQLARRLGLEDELLPTSGGKRTVFVLHKGRPEQLPDGVLLIVPTKFGPFIRSRLISPLGKLRMGLDVLVPAKRDGEDETLADFISRRLGREALDKIAEPLLSGIYNAEAERQSILATFPRFRQLETKYGSLIRGMLASRAARAAAPRPSGPRPASTFMSFNGGMETLVDALVAAIDADMRLETPVAGIERHGDQFRVILGSGDWLPADEVVLAVPSYVAADLVEPLTPAAAARLRGIRYVSTGTITLAYRTEDVPNPLEGVGLVVPRSERRDINAITWTTAKFDRRAPDDHILIRVFFGGSRSPHMMALDDEALLEAVRVELAAMIDLRATPAFHQIYRWIDANPQYDVGHLDRVEAIEAALPPGIQVTGSPYRGVGVPDCVRQSEETAGRVLLELRRRVSSQDSVSMEAA